MPPTYSDWIQFYPGDQFITTDAARQALITRLLSQFWNEHPFYAWGALQVSAVTYFTAHWLTVTSAGTPGATAFPMGPVTSLSTSQGSQSVGFGQGTGKGALDKNLEGTIYGMQYLRYKQSLGIVGRVI